MLEKRAEHI